MGTLYGDLVDLRMFSLVRYMLLGWFYNFVHPYTFCVCTCYNLNVAF